MTNALQVWSVTDVHLALLNPVHGPNIRRALGGGLVFLLSRFLWTARAELGARVRVTSRPPRDWDGVRPLRDTVSRIRAAGRLVVAVHLRTSPNTPWLHFDHWSKLREDAESPEGGAGGAGRYCGGDGRTGLSAAACVADILEEHAVRQRMSMYTLRAALFTLYRFKRPLSCGFRAAPRHCRHPSRVHRPPRRLCRRRLYRYTDSDILIQIY